MEQRRFVVDAEEAQLILHSILEDVVNGRLEGHLCPFCRRGELQCEHDNGFVRVSCNHCGAAYEGILR